MENRGGEIHMDTNEARGGSTPHVVRWVLIVGLVLAVGFLSLTWITGALGARHAEEDVAVSDQLQAEESARAALASDDGNSRQPSGPLKE